MVIKVTPKLYIMYLKVNWVHYTMVIKVTPRLYIMYLKVNWVHYTKLQKNNWMPVLFDVCNNSISTTRHKLNNVIISDNYLLFIYSMFVFSFILNCINFRWETKFRHIITDVVLHPLHNIQTRQTSIQDWHLMYNTCKNRDRQLTTTGILNSHL
jgi:hypothetical protein